MCDCYVLGSNIKLINNSLEIGDKIIQNIPFELKKILLEEKLKITNDSTRLLINEWELKNGVFKKTLRGYIHKYL